MLLTRLAAAAFTISSFVGIAACSSSEEGNASIVSEARADPATSKDYGWRASPDFSSEKKDEVREYY